MTSPRHHQHAPPRKAHQWWKERQGRHRTPPALPRTRPRTLTSPCDAVSQQFQSPFFCLLSAELRNYIYELVLANGGFGQGRELHLASIHRRLGCIRCFDSDSGKAGRNHDCWGGCYMDGTHKCRLERDPPDTSIINSGSMQEVVSHHFLYHLLRFQLRFLN